MHHQSVRFVVWLGVAVLALVWASVYMWHTGRLLHQVQQDRATAQIRFVPAPAPEFTSVSDASAIAS
jgi:hypothetical protein